jgi:hypothetical protein
MYKIVTGCARDVENELNELSVKYWIDFHGVSADKDQTTVVVELNER